MRNIIRTVIIGVCGLTFSCCNDFLDREPISNITPDVYLTEETQLASYANGMYADILPSNSSTSFGIFGIDEHTDNMAGESYSNKYVPGQWKVGQSGGEWSFDIIYRCNYFLERVIPLWKDNALMGAEENIKHYIGEIYFFRAYEYFNKLQKLGDFPIITTTMPEQTHASKRSSPIHYTRFGFSNSIDEGYRSGRT